jgi:CheY-like chemotaxis protein
VVNNGFGAGMLAKEYHPDLIILDVMLPDINGQAVCELIRRDPTMADIKIICISGMIEESGLRTARMRCGRPLIRRCPTIPLLASFRLLGG